MSILPNQILPPNTPFLNPDGTVAHDWWLFFYNVSEAAIGSSGSSAGAFAAQTNADLDVDVDTSDLKGIADRISSLENAVTDPLPVNAAGSFNNFFQSGYVQYCGPNNSLNSSINLIFGLSLPNPSGTNSAALLLGSGFGVGGSGNPGQAWLITDQAYDNVTAGNTLGITAGETQAAGTANGGQLELYGGGSFGGTGGATLVQGGTSLNGPGGLTTIAGGSSTNSTPGDLYLTAGLNAATNSVGGNVHLIMTKFGSGAAGNIRIRVNSTILYQFDEHGAIFIAASAGTAGQVLTSGGVGASTSWGPATTGYSGTITTAKLTVGGTNGSMTFANGVLTSQTAAT